MSYAAKVRRSEVQYSDIEDWIDTNHVLDSPGYRDVLGENSIQC